MTLFSISRLLKRTKSTDMNKFLIVGLGNIGIDYAMTRHNIGFEILDLMSEIFEDNYESRRYGEILRTKTNGKSLIFLKPNTFMNLSGKAIKYWKNKENIVLPNKCKFDGHFKSKTRIWVKTSKLEDQYTNLFELV